MSALPLKKPLAASIAALVAAQVGYFLLSAPAYNDTVPDLERVVAIGRTLAVVAQVLAGALLLVLILAAYAQRRRGDTNGDPHRPPSAGLVHPMVRAEPAHHEGHDGS